MSLLFSQDSCNFQIVSPGNAILLSCVHCVIQYLYVTNLLLLLSHGGQAHTHYSIGIRRIPDVAYSFLPKTPIFCQLHRDTFSFFLLGKYFDQIICNSLINASTTSIPQISNMSASKSKQTTAALVASNDHDLYPYAIFSCESCCIFFHVDLNNINGLSSTKLLIVVH